MAPELRIAGTFVKAAGVEYKHRMMKIVFLIGMFTATGAFARGVCEAEMARHCLGVLQLGHQELNQCLIDHYDLLGEECQNSLPKDAKSRMRPLPKKAAAASAHGEGSAGHTPAH